MRLTVTPPKWSVGCPCWIVPMWKIDTAQIKENIFFPCWRAPSDMRRSSALAYFVARSINITFLTEERVSSLGMRKLRVLVFSLEYLYSLRDCPWNSLVHHGRQIICLSFSCLLLPLSSRKGVLLWTPFLDGDTPGAFWNTTDWAVQRDWIGKSSLCEFMFSSQDAFGFSDTASISGLNIFAVGRRTWLEQVDGLSTKLSRDDFNTCCLLYVSSDLWSSEVFSPNSARTESIWVNNNRGFQYTSAKKSDCQPD